jgi:short-subunit dehydrogenase
MRLDGRVVLISGASRGVGAELARQAVAKGSLVGLLARTATDLEALQAELGNACAIATADVSSYDDVVTAVGKLTAELGRVDVLVNNAGIGLYGAFLDAEVADIERIIRVNYLGVVHLLKAVLPGMVERRSGHLVTIGSISGRIGSPFEAAYSASKFAVTGLTEALSVELAPLGIDVSLVNPGPIDTPFFAARGHAYDRAHPKPVSAQRVAARVLSVVEGRRSESFISPLLRQAVIAKTLVPPLFRWGTARTFADELKSEARR